MEVRYSPHFLSKYKKFPAVVKKKFDKQIFFLAKSLTYPSLRAKKFHEARGIWQARVDRSHRFYFLIKKDVYILLDITKHKK